MKRLLAFFTAIVMAVGVMAGCTGNNGGTSSADTSASGSSSTAAFDASKGISVVSREDGSGTRGAFIELFGVEEKDESGEKVDHTTLDAIITNSTAVMMTTIAGDEYAIGYISLGSLDNTVKAVKIDGAEATVANIESDTYKIYRPFNIVTGENVSEVAQDFIDYIMSADGQKVIEDNGYIAVSENEAYAGSKPSGKVVVAGSSSVTPVMEKLKEAYLAINPNANIEVQQSDSSTGISYAADGSCDIGMASRELKDSELAQGLTPTVIAQDGIAVVVNNNCPLDELTSDQVKAIFTGAVTTWKDILAE